MSSPLTAEELARIDEAAQEAGIAAADDDGKGARWFIRPRLGAGWQSGSDDHPVWLGLEYGRSAWSLDEDFAITGSGSISADFPAGPGTVGRDLRLGALAGPRLGRLSLMFGPAVGEHELHWTGGDLAASWLVAGRAVLAFDAELLSAWIGHTAWSSLDDRRAPADGWPGLGDEPEWAGGTGVRLGPIQLRAELSHRDTAEAALWRTVFGCQDPAVIALLPLLALAGPQPLALVLDDPLPWDKAAKGMIDGPPGCHDARGIARFTFTMHQMPDLLSAPRAKRWVFAGRVEGKLVDGTWVPFVATLGQIEPVPTADEEAENAGSDLLPLIGTRTDSRFSVRSGGSEATIEGDDVPMNLIRRAIEEWGGSQETQFVQWDAVRDGVLFRRDVPITEKNKRETSKVEVFFPGSGLLPAQMDVIFPHNVTVGDFPWRARLTDAQLHVRAEIRDGASWPTFESGSLVASVLGFTFGIEQTIVWEGWAPCSTSD